VIVAASQSHCTTWAPQLTGDGVWHGGCVFAVSIDADLAMRTQTAMVITTIMYFKTHFCFIAIGGAKAKAGRRAPEDT
jgi:hypothetical protein